MRDLKKQEQAAIEAVARRFSATWERGGDPPDDYLEVAGKRVAVDIITLKRHGTGHGREARPGLRFDKVATRLLERLQAAAGETVPNGMTLLLTITAPIRLPSRTAALLQDKIGRILGRSSPGRDEKHAIHGNRIRLRLMRDPSGRAPKMIAFVHNLDSDPLLLLNMTREMLALAAKDSGRRSRRPAENRWLVGSSARGASCLETYRYIDSQLATTTGFEKILIVFADGRVGELTG